MLTYLLDNFSTRPDENIMDLAAKNGNLLMVRALHIRGESCT